MNVGTGTKTTSGGTDSDSGQTNSAKEDKQYIQISPETVELIAETIGITNLDTSTAIVLAEDASYRCREVANICGQLMRHAKRRKLTAQDVNEALDLYDADPVLGHDATDPVSYTMLKDNTSTEYENLDILYVPDEKLVDLRSHALSQSPPVVAIEPSIQATWLSVEGHYCPENEEAKPVDFPQQANVTPALMQYYSTIISVTLGDSEVMMNTITKDLEVNTNIGTLLPFIVSFIRTGMQKHCENKVLMRRLLCLLQSLFSNSSLNLSPKPYLSHLVTALLSSLIVDRPGQQRNLSSNQSGGGMWNGHNDLILNIDHVQHASRILRQVMFFRNWSKNVHANLVAI
jgi:transcription initiation factor TFIID subunit 6